MIPCLSTKNCIAPPVAGLSVVKIKFHFQSVEIYISSGLGISANPTAVEGHDWMFTETEYTCDDPDSSFYVPEVSYAKTFPVSCEVDKIFGKKFPYWKIPGTDYPKKKEIYCAFPTRCYNFIDVDPPMGPLGLSDNFDFINNQMTNQFQYFCSMDGDRGMFIVD